MSKAIEPAPAPAPLYILRGHTAQINTLHFSSDNRWLLSGDSDGFVAIWSLTSFRPVVFLKAHEGSVLTVSTWGKGKFVTHGRDNKIHVFPFDEDGVEISYRAMPSPANPSSHEPQLTIETNALGYCKCSLLALDEEQEQAWIAVPATLHDELVDIFHLPSGKRIHRSIGKNAFESKTGTVMALSLYRPHQDNLQLVTTYEDGRVALFSLTTPSGRWSEPFREENEGWTKIFESREHREPTMGLALDLVLKRAWTVSADNLVTRYVLDDLPGSQDRSRAYKTAYPGRGGIAVRNDGRILAIAGWDSYVRIHSAKTFKPLAVLDYHRDSVFAVAFASVLSGERRERERQHNSRLDGNRAWIAAGGKDERISLWELYPPHAQDVNP